MPSRLRPILMGLAAFIVIGIIIPIVIPTVVVNLLAENKTTTGITNKTILKVFESLRPQFVAERVPGMNIVIFVDKGTIFLIGMILTGLALALHIVLKRKHEFLVTVRKQTMEVLPLIASFVRTGMSIVDSLLHTASITKPPISHYLERFARLIRLGSSPEDVFESIFHGFPSDAKALLRSIVIAMKSGGRVAEILDEATRFSYQLVRLDELREHRLAQYKFISLIAVLAFAIASVIVVALISSIIAPPEVVRILPGAATVQIDVINAMYFYTSMILLIISSAAVSRITTGTFVMAPKYIAILAPIITILMTFWDLVL